MLAGGQYLVAPDAEGFWAAEPVRLLELWAWLGDRRVLPPEQLVRIVFEIGEQVHLLSVVDPKLEKPLTAMHLLGMAVFCLGLEAAKIGALEDRCLH